MTLWKARFIAADNGESGAPLFRHEFSLDQGHGAVRSAILSLSALGVCEAFVNGRAVSDDLLTPGWSSYEWRVRYAEYDVSELLQADSAIGVMVGNGWYRGRLGFGQGAETYGDELGAFAELRITFADNHVQVVATGPSWRSHPSAVTFNDFYDGQSIDARLHQEGWVEPGFDDTGWDGVHELAFDTGMLEPYIGPPVRRHQEIQPKRVWTSPSGATLVDFGQNLVGWVKARITGPAGRTLTLRHAEVLENGEIGVRPLRSAQATDRFTLSGGEDVFEPTLTLHGFRYVEVTGWPGELAATPAGDFAAVVVSSVMQQTGYFDCSNPLLNRLHENVVWSMRGNFVDVPTDCPQRDERLGWTGDLAVFAPTAAFLFDSKDFLRDWLRDLSLEQTHQDGVVPLVVPNTLRRMRVDPGLGEPEATAVWGDAAVWVPWALWEAYGDQTVLAEAYDSMAAHVRRFRPLLSPTGLWDTGFQFGDWLDPDAPPEEPWAAKADVGVVATACAYRSTTMVANAAELLGRAEDHQEFAGLASQLRAAFRQHYIGNGRITSDAPTVYGLAIMFGLLNPDEEAWAGTRLAELVADSGYHISTGFAGTPFITDALSRTGHTDTAYKLLLQPENPSWLYPVRMGATTIWERWDSMLPDGSINPGEMTSFNHYAFGSVADWMHRVVAGISPLEPGYRRILIAPQPGGNLLWAQSQVHTPYGKASVRWTRTGQDLTIKITVPEGSTAVLRLPDTEDRPLDPGNHSLKHSLPQ